MRNNSEANRLIKRAIPLLLAILLFLLAGCAKKEQPMDGDDMFRQAEHTQAAVISTPTLVIEANGKTFHATLEKNTSADAFVDKLNSGAIKVDMHDYGSFEKVGPLPWSLERNDIQIATEPGDVILYQGNQITIYYDWNTWTFTKLAKIETVTKEELLEVFGEGDVTVSFRLEWSE